MNIKHGDIVRLRTGSPDLIVVGILQPDDIIQVAYWSTSDTKVASFQLPSYAFELVKAIIMEEETEILEGITIDA